MPRITRARADARRRQIIEAALTCFARRGFHKTTMQDVVEQSGLSPGSIYCHFASKQDIIVAVVEERHRRERASLQRAFEKQSFAEAVDQLAADFIAALRAPEERAWRRLTVQLWAESLHDRRLAVAVRDGVESSKAILARLVQRAKARGELPRTLDAHATARLLIAFFQGLVLQLTWDGNVDMQACLIALKALIAPGRAGDRQAVGVGNPRAFMRPRLETRASGS
jgi:TetR/AcrR family transcriptional regulator, transcriptional repressor of aconitase